ncbi:RecQ family ATP-dependent DNA helicase [Persicobacter psychrovividus]|uniref:ATP-dependent DNA helicase RecQ n=1 Tax=Persicobacter psychrovividus TaxID=387638 RepID=A0ABN6L6G1_9BACT|nr:ATP-dependent DNA helicase RecQ [Persicobacter psychrovividus]
MSELKQHLQAHFGFDTFRGGQEKVIQTLVDSESAGAIFPTGSGKSLCYQLPAVLLPHLTVVVSPLLALIQDQLKFLNKNNIPACRIDSTLKPKEAKKIQEDLRAGKYKVLFIAVERFKNERFRQFLHELQLSLLVIDEAHCISEWGHNFRPDYMKIPQYMKDFGFPQVLLLTATAPPRVYEDMAAKFNIPLDNFSITGFHRPNLILKVEPHEEEERQAKLIEYLKDHDQDSAVVYVTLQKDTERLSYYLKEAGINSTAFHGGMLNDQRKDIQQKFMTGEITVIVATIAFGMGIDKSDIRHVIHYHLPKSIENYSQEIGRAGRDGKDAQCIMMADATQLPVLENFVYGDTPDKESVARVLRSIKRAENNLWEPQVYDLSFNANFKQTPLRTFLVYLENEGLLTPSHSYYAEYKANPVILMERITRPMDAEKKALTEAIFKYSPKARMWYTIDFEKIKQNFPAGDRFKIIEILEELEEQNVMKLEAKKLKEAYNLHIPEGVDIEDFTDKYDQMFQEREATEIQRLRDLMAFFQGEGCLSKKLSAYFGEETDWDECGKCSYCETKKAADFPALAEITPIDEAFNFEEVYNKSLKTLDEKHITPRYLATFLAGMAMPKFSRMRKKKDGGFGVLADYPFAEVIAWVGSGLENRAS